MFFFVSLYLSFPNGKTSNCHLPQCAFPQFNLEKINNFKVKYFKKRKNLPIDAKLQLFYVILPIYAPKHFRYCWAVYFNFAKFQLKKCP